MVEYGTDIFWAIISFSLFCFFLSIAFVAFVWYSLKVKTKLNSEPPPRQFSTKVKSTCNIPPTLRSAETPSISRETVIFASPSTSFMQQKSPPRLPMAIECQEERAPPHPQEWTRPLAPRNEDLQEAVYGPIRHLDDDTFSRAGIRYPGNLPRWYVALYNDL